MLGRLHLCEIEASLPRRFGDIHLVRIQPCYLRTRLPKQYELAEVVGKWVWLDVSPARKPGLASWLWALGFHWNQRRGVWQHLCGRFDPFGAHPTDPRTKYRSYFPADVFPT